MKGLGIIAICLAGGLMLSVSLRASDVASSGNPYGPIVVRNVFGLNPPTIPDATPPGDPPPKITPNGIMTIFGQLQVLFKVAPVKPGPGAKEESYVLSEGQQQDDIEVTQINEKAGIITFNNHGTVQTLPLANTPALNTPGAPGGGMAPSPSFPMPGGGIPSRFGGRPGIPGGPGNAGGRGRAPASGGDNANNGMGGSPPVNSRGIYSPDALPASTLSPEERAAAALINAAKLKNDGNPAWKLMPTVPGATLPEE